MEEPRQRATYPKIIDEKNLKTKKRVFIETALTLGFWGLICYFFVIFATFMLWLFGLKLVYYEIYEVGYGEMVRLFKNGGTLTTIVVLAFLSWSYYNIALIKIKGERRKNQVRICFDEDMAKYFHIDCDMLERIKNNSHIYILLDKNGIIFNENYPSISQDK
jgi:poly-beta-1,6-N-acetyl-D-glucosamine biosynthesis protein PgaD